MEKSFVIKGSFVFSKDINTIKCVDDGYLVCDKGVVAGVFPAVPAKYRDLRVIDYTGKIIVPGMTDLHLHAPQYSFRGLKMDLELMEWLNANTFPEESKYADKAYSDSAYFIFAEDLIKSFTTRACIFATIHKKATMSLMHMLEDSGIKSYVGKVNSDRNVCDALCETTEGSLKDTEEWIRECGMFKNAKPILTPRFTPACTDKLMEGLGRLAEHYKIPVQSHLDENPSEIAFVKELCPDSKNYSETYEKYGLFGGDARTIMAHCVYPTNDEINMLKEKGVYVAHCPQSNINLASGIAPLRKFIEKGIKVGLGTDIAGGASISMFRAITDTIQVSKLYFRYIDKADKPVNVEEAFYLATVGGGSFFGKVGTFLEGYELDALVLDDSNIPHPQELTTRDRFERMLYLATSANLCAKYVAGNKVL